MKNFFFGALLATFVGAVVFFAYQLGKGTGEPIVENQESPSPVVSESETSEKEATTPAPNRSPEKSVEELIKQAFLSKHHLQRCTCTVSISNNDGNFASGTIKDEGGGGYFYAAKVSGVWQIVADGNGVILCSDLEPYPNYPTSLISECYDQNSNKVTKR